MAHFHLLPINLGNVRGRARGASISTETDELPLDQGRDLFGVVYACATPRIFQPDAVCRISGHSGDTLDKG